MTDKDSYGNVYEFQVKQGTDDVNTVKKAMLGTQQQFSQAILNISKMSQMFNSGGVISGGKLNFEIDQNVPPGHVIMYTGSPGVSNTIHHYSGGAGGSGSVAGAISYGGGGGGSYAGGNYMTNWVEGYYEPFKPEPVNTEELVEKIVTRYVPGETLVVCVDNELSSAQIDEMKAQLLSHKIEGIIIIRGATAGTGRPAGQVPSSPQWRIDILARLAETWERHPDLTLAELLRWWSGENMTDGDFAAATDVYAKKVYE